MKKTALAMALGTVTCLAGATRDARACGGCFHPPTESGTVITDHRMIFAISPQQTTLYDQIQYQGSPSSFAWVLPIHGTVTVGLSSDVLFDALDQATTPTIVGPQLPACPTCGCTNASVGFGGGGASSSSSGGPGVTVLQQQVVGPYDTVQLSTTDPMALTDWLTANGFDIPTAVQPILAAYVGEQFNFLAMRLAPGQGVQAMRPVSVTSAGAGLSLPLRMVAAGTGAIVGIKLWVVATGRYEPMNFPQFTISGSELTWDWNIGESNYTTVRSQKEAAMKNAAWQVESSLDLSPFQIESTVLANPAEVDYPTPALDAGLEAGPEEGGVSGLTLSPEEARQQDLSTCFPGGNATEVRVTRLRADLAQAALANDLVLQASADQGPVSNIYQVTQSVNAPVCATIDQATCGCTPNSGSSGETKSASPGQQSFGCSTSLDDTRGGGLELALIGLFGAAIVGGRARRKQESSPRG